MHRPRRLSGRVLVAILIAGGLQSVGPLHAATCQETIDRFERRLLTSSIATRDSDKLQQLLDEAEEARELRDDERCVAIVAELDQELPENDRRP